ncbi:MAG: PAS domain-containing protein [Pseudomonadota bacterium]
MRDAPARLLALADRASIPVSIADATAKDQPLVYVNEAFSRQSGYRRDEIVGRNCRFLQGPDTDQMVRRHIGELLQAHKEVVCAIANYTKTGEPFDNFLIMRAIPDANGEPAFVLGCQHFHKRRVDLDALRRHIETEDLLQQEFCRTMDAAFDMVERSRRIAADTMFALAERYLRRSQIQGVLRP